MLKPCLHVTELCPETADHAGSMVRTVSSAGLHVSRLVISFTGAAFRLRHELQPQLMLSMAMPHWHCHMSGLWAWLIVFDCYPLCCLRGPYQDRGLSRQALGSKRDFVGRGILKTIVRQSFLMSGVRDGWPGKLRSDSRAAPAVLPAAVRLTRPVTAGGVTTLWSAFVNHLKKQSRLSKYSWQPDLFSHTKLKLYGIVS